MIIYLRTKVVSLADEARTIRRYERSIKRNHRRLRDELKRVPAGTPPPAAWWGLREHRRAVVRPESRAAGLALAFLRGRDYRACEGPTTRTSPDWSRVEALVKKYGEDDVRDRMQRFSAWKDAA